MGPSVPQAQQLVCACASEVALFLLSFNREASRGRFRVLRDNPVKIIPDVRGSAVAISLLTSD